MKAKDYIKNAKEALEGQLEKVNYDLNTKSKFYTFGMIAGLLGGLCIAASSPWFAVPVFGGVISCIMGKNHLKKTLGDKKNRLEGELTHLKGVESKGLDTRPETDKKRKSFLDSMKKTRDQQEAEYKDADHRQRWMDALWFGTSFAALWFPGPILACLPIAFLAGKHFANKDLEEKQEALEATAHRMNNVANDFNISVYTNQAKQKAAQQNRPVMNQAKTNGRTASKVAQPKVQPQPRKTYSKADEEAVEEYLRQMNQQATATKGVQKRKI